MSGVYASSICRAFAVRQSGQNKVALHSESSAREVDLEKNQAKTVRATIMAMNEVSELDSESP